MKDWQANADAIVNKSARLMQYLKFVCCFICSVVLLSNIWTISHWVENRGINDDFCYQRQAHLFQKYGFGGLDTDVSKDDEKYFSAKMKDANLPDWKDISVPPCHTVMPLTNKRVIQYPPGTGLVMALFPEGHQVIALFTSANIVVFVLGLLAISYATTIVSITLTASLADLTLYMMINPTKASYSMAPTMVLCTLVGFLTARLLVNPALRHRLLLVALIGFLIGFGTNFRLPNLVLSAGYFIFFGIAVLRLPKIATIVEGGLFGTMVLVGAAPTLVANSINAGSVFSTTYGYGDASAPRVTAGVAWAYLTDFQFALVLLASGWIAFVLRFYNQVGIRQVAFVTAGNLLVNVAFFLSHPGFLKYYMIPIATLSLWSLLFATLMQFAEKKVVAKAGREIEYEPGTV